MDNPYNKERARLEAQLSEAQRTARIWTEGFEAGYIEGKSDAAQTDYRHEDELRYILEPLEARDRTVIKHKIHSLSRESVEGYAIAEVISRALKVFPTLELDDGQGAK